MKLETKGISVAIRERQLVTNASIHVASGELVGLIGPNGAGKSTLLRAMLGIQERTNGDVRLDGKDFLSMPSRERARAVAFLPQERRVEWRLPGYDIVMLGRYPHQAGFGGPTRQDRAAVDRALDAVDGRGIIDRPVSVLSGGERTRILLARALAVEAPLLLVDEPIAALDPYHQLHVMEILRERAREGVGVLAIIHDLELAARFMDRLILMNGGQIVADGTPASVLTTERVADVYRITGSPPTRIP
ncbi:MAG: ABC transporter ATP-binding protein [Alphaproteobacteria bacterium]|nr:MAG: ABC transporter ATP-binding protein [Alphaproteobacteria bacterium]